MVIGERKRTLDYRPPPFPEGFGERLEGLKEMTGLSWRQPAVPRSGQPSLRGGQSAIPEGQPQPVVEEAEAELEGVSRGEGVCQAAFESGSDAPDEARHVRHPDEPRIRSLEAGQHVAGDFVGRVLGPEP